MDIQTAAVTYLLGYMAAFGPDPARITYGPKETRTEWDTRLGQMAEDAVTVAFDPAEPNLYPEEGERGRVHTALVIAAISRYESNYRLDIDKGLPPLGLGDNGRSFCSMQVNVGLGNSRTPPWSIKYQRWASGPADHPVVRWSGKDLLADRKNCFRAGLHALKVSYNGCGPGAHNRFRLYASGSCLRAGAISIRRARHIEGYWADHPFRVDYPEVIFPAIETAFLTIHRGFFSGLGDIAGLFRDRYTPEHVAGNLR